MRKIVKALLAGLAAVVMVLATSTAASAGSNGPEICNTNYSACAKFYHDGDVIRVWDTACDGRAGMAHVWAPEAGIYVNLWNTGGCNTYADHGFGTSMPENVAVYYQACRGIKYADGTYELCSGTGGGRS